LQPHFQSQTVVKYVSINNLMVTTEKVQ